MLNQAVADISAILDLIDMRQMRVFDAQFLTQPTHGAIHGRLIPVRVSATRIRPQTGRVVLAQRAALDQRSVAVNQENADRLMTQAPLMRLKFFNRGQDAIDPGGDHDGHMRLAEPRPSSRYAGSLNMSQTWANSGAEAISRRILALHIVIRMMCRQPCETFKQDARINAGPLAKIIKAFGQPPGCGVAANAEEVLQKRPFRVQFR